MPHDHAHAHLDPASGDRRVSLAIWASGLLTLAQIAGGLASGSLALIADAVHDFSDMAALVIAYGARKLARRPADAAMTFGYGRIEIVAALINYTTLVLLGLFLIYEGAMRIVDPPQVGGWTVVIVAGVALAVDALTWSMQRHRVNIRALFLHNVSDALASVAVMVGGALILLYDWRLVDPLVTIGIALYILYLALSEIGGPIRTLMLGSPDHIDNAEVIAAVCAVEGVAGVHHVHFWQMQEHAAALDCHVVLTGAGWPAQETVKAAIKAMLADRFGIGHSTLEFEHVDRAHDGAALYGCHDGPLGGRA
ncbi:cation diffusion facilitator family transporter [Rhodovulum marinum]|uniref:Cobalt-zinc-cadmium efflux system protein n=1 Tax=Rhodovulum marinum TaxID=320662 RepID=A0A4R2Q621_9RHOB|nr:cation diffusion facilitator family transporter [Rhodovulum marinum]TCP42201.1 cobalt-zinc-cadmium efflux system protein [Rhodovulum marinum]